MDVKISIKDNMPDIFFGETICGIPFIFDSTEYSSVYECFNDRKYSTSLWFPPNVPYKHKINLTPEGFLLNEERCICYDNGDGKFTPDQFKSIVCASLFVMYYDQIKDGLTEEQLLRYCSQYYACKGLVARLGVDTSHVCFQPYEPDFMRCECVAICNNKSKLDIELLNWYQIVHMSYEDFNNSYSYKLQSENRKFDIVVHDVTGETIDNYMADVQISKLSNVSVVRDPIDYEDVQIIAFNTISDDIKAKNKIDWNNVYYWEGC